MYVGRRGGDGPRSPPSASWRHLSTSVSFVLGSVGGAVSSWVIAACSRWGAGSLGAVAIRMSNYGLRVRAWISADFRVCRFSRRKYLSSPCMLPGGDSYILVGASVGASAGASVVGLAGL